MINEKKLREKLKWFVHPFQKSGGVPKDLIDRIVNIVKAVERQSRNTTKRQLELKVKALETEIADMKKPQKTSPELQPTEETEKSE